MITPTKWNTEEIAMVTNTHTNMPHMIQPPRYINSETLKQGGKMTIEQKICVNAAKKHQTEKLQPLPDQEG